ncbi:hypothetical protein CRI94_12330 [Longibacter salinarum]|uniref:Uncharacterized protein n=1 Tax=Longibacter salinarum TaxID=1850348 RepID=A0A2A8CW27_9BACT|nr:hypothetical protein [Longibacter salinarum]PEN12794.1 hypothetical protein CRI94_12330 [Longibacter salinarum]
MPLLVAAFSGTSLVYWADRVLEFSPEDTFAHPDRVRWVRSHETWLRMEAVGLVGAGLATLPWLRVETLLGAAVCAGLGIVHVAPVLPGGRRLKSLPWGKQTSIAATWATGGVILPWLQAGGSSVPLHVVAVLVLARAVLVWANVAVADWTDRCGDQAVGLGSESCRSGQEVKRVAIGAALFGGALIVALGATGLASLSLALVDAVGAGGLALAIARTRPRAAKSHVLVLDLLIAWPAVAYGVSLLP